MQNRSRNSPSRSDDSIPEDSITIHLNGESEEVAAGKTITTLLKDQGVDPARTGIAIARNDQLVRREEWEKQIVEDGDRIEVITALQGG